LSAKGEIVYGGLCPIFYHFSSHRKLYTSTISDGKR
jgi:hypothetical protein